MITKSIILDIFLFRRFKDSKERTLDEFVLLTSIIGYNSKIKHIEISRDLY